MCDKVVCERWLDAAAREEARDTETNTRTPHKVVGKNIAKPVGQLGPARVNSTKLSSHPS